MKKKILFLVLTAITVICMIVSCGEKGDFTYEKVDGGIAITGYTGEEMNVVIPEAIDKNTVVAIGDAAFDRALIESIEIPESVTKIGKYAFRRCGKLTSVIIKGDVETIETGTFNFCMELKKINLPDTVTSIEENAFGMSGLTEITLPDSVKALGEMVFYNCGSFKAFKSGKGLEEIGGACFSGCAALTDITLNEGLKSVGEMAFSGCSIENIEIPEGVEILETMVFAGCPFTEYTVSSGIKTIKNSAFGGCKALKKIYIPETVETIEADSFLECKGLVICGIRDSRAEIFADTYGFKFEEYNFE